MFSENDLFVKNTFYYFSLVSVSVIILIFLYSRLWKTRSETVPKTVLGRSVLFLTVLTYFGLGLILYPGFIGNDDLFLALHVQKGMPSGWHSFSYSVFLTFCLGIFQSFFANTVVVLILFLGIISKVIRIIEDGLDKKYQKISLVALTILLVNPLLLSQIFFQCRDTLFSLTLVYLTLYFFRKTNFSWWEVCVISFLSVMMGDLRQEAKFLPIIIPVLMFVCHLWNQAQVRVSAVTTIFFAGFFYGFAPWYFDYGSYSKAYQSTSMILPLSKIYHVYGKERISPVINEKINRVLDIEKLEKYYSPVDIDPFHNGAFNYSATDSDWVEFKDTARGLIFENWGLFLEGRFELLKSMLNGGVPQLIFTDYSDSNEVAYQKVPREWIGQSHFPDLRFEIRSGLHSLLESSGFWIRLLLFGCSIPILFLIFCVFKYKRIGIIGVVAWLVFFRLPIIFLIAPASYLKYISSVLMFFTFYFPVLIASHQSLFQRFLKKSQLKSSDF